MDLVSAPETVSHFQDAYNKCTIRYGDMKKQLAEDVIAFTAPFYDKIQSYVSNSAYLKKVMDVGQEKARASALATIKEARSVIGFSR